jgi:asparagine N-glycosylation enzyme membrane subunit Stt3
MNRHRTTFLVFSIFLFNLLLRLLPFHQVFTGGNIIFLDGDSYYHMRRILLITQNFPHISFYDYYMNFPDGAMSPWPPLYDVFVAAIAYLAGLGAPSVRTVETVAAVMPPILGALTVLPVYFFARRLFDEKIALWGAFFFSLVPGHIQYTFVGRPDHHAIEPLVLTVFSLIIIVSIQGYDKRKYPYLLPIAGGMVLAAGMLVWTGSIIYLAVAVFGLLTLAVATYRTGPSSSSSSLFVTVFLASVTAALLISLYLILTGTWKPYSYITLSGFHALMIFFVAVFTVVTWYVFRILQNKHTHWLYLVPAVLAVISLLSLLFYLLFPEMIQPLLDGLFKQIGKSSEWRKSISESRPLFSVLTVRGYEFSVGNATDRAGWAVLLTPVALAFMLMKKNRNDNLVFFALWSSVFLALTLNQMRYLYYFAVSIGIMTAFLMVKAQKSKILEGRRALAPLVFIILFYPTFVNAIHNAGGAGGEITLNPNGMDMVKTMLWIRDNTPSPGDFISSGERPAYGIMSTWGFGHELTYIARRPAVANNFADVLQGKGYPDSLRFFTSVSLQESYEILSDHQARFVYVVAPDYYSAMAARMSGKQMPGYFTDAWKPTSKALNEIVVFRLYFLDGKDIGRFRLVYESERPYISERFRKNKVFEFVKGVMLKGNAVPGSRVSASLQLASNQGRSFTYENSVITGRDGIFELTLPYATSGSPYKITAREGYTLNINGKTRMVNISEAMVREGSEIDVR